MLKMVCFVVFIDNIQYHPIIHTSHYPLIRPIGSSGDRGGGGGGGWESNMGRTIYKVGVGIEGGNPG